MTDVWPADVYRQLRRAPTEAIRAPRCLLLMPFDQKFDDITRLIHDTVNAVFEQFKDFFDLPEVNRLDWVSSSGAIQQQIWQKIIEADLVICDLTEHNANVMFESGVTAAWKNVTQVVFIRDRTFTGRAPFDTAPIRYTEYDRSSYTGIKHFQERLSELVREVFISFPDGAAVELSHVPAIYKTSFADGRDDLAISTAPFAHRRVTNGLLEFGSRWMYPHSWASIGNERFYEFELTFTATFRNPLPDGNCFIGVGLRSQHYYANFAHILYLNRDGRIVITEPNDRPPKYYEDNVLRGPTPSDPTADHTFHVTFDAATLQIKVDDFQRAFPLAELKKVLGPGVIRFQAYRTWMGLRSLSLRTQ
jgi:hypothetical protein